MGHSELEYREVRTGHFECPPDMEEMVLDVLRSGRISYGPMSQAFERQFATQHDCTYAVLSNSGTSSLHVALQTLKELHGWNDGDSVLVPASTFVATVNIVLHNNLRPVFVDIEPATYGMDPEALQKILEQDNFSDPRCIIPVHLYGQPCRMLEIMALAEEYDLAIIEDSCEAMFVEHHGAKVGSMGQIGCFSTYNAHLITTGVGGLATTNEPSYAAYMRSLVNHGLAIEELNTDECFSPRFNIGRSFRFSQAGHSYRITELEAVMGLYQLWHRDTMLRTRRRNARHLLAGMKNTNQYHDANLFLPDVAEGNEHAWMMFPIVLDPKRAPKQQFTRYLNKHGIETRDMMPIVSQPIYQDLLDPMDYPTSYWVDKNGFYIGCHPSITPDDVEYVHQVFRRWDYDAACPID